MKTILLLSALPLLLAACSTQAPNAQVDNAPDTLFVATSFYPLTFVVEHIGKDMIDVYQISSQGADPHTYEPTPQQLERVYNADLLVFNGLGQDAWADRIQQDLKNQGTNILIATESVSLMDAEEDHDDHHGEEEHEKHDHGTWDPHVWLDPLLLKQIAESVAAELTRLDPKNAPAYKENTESFTSALEELHSEIQEGLNDCTLNSVIVSHDAFRYLANRYNFETLEIAGLSPSADPSPARLAELSKLAEDKGIRHVFFETHVSPALSNTLAGEIGAETLVLHSIEALTSDEQTKGITYFDLMRQNLHNLRTAMQCS